MVMLNEHKEHLLLFASSDKILEIWIFEYIQNSKIMLAADAKDATEAFSEISLSLLFCQGFMLLLLLTTGYQENKNTS